jgi:methyl-accepting chemotaxis protein
MVILAVIVGGVGIFTTGHLLENDANRMINLIANVQEEELNILLKGVEQSVQIMETQTLSNLESLDKLVNDAEYRKEYSKHLCGLFKNVSKHTEGAIAFYLRFNPNLISDDKGFLWNRPDVESSFSEIEPTNILEYDANDKENVGWYHIPVEKGRASWIMPHQNKSHGGYMISYVIPMYVDGQLIGVVGMGLDFDIFMEELEYVSIYKTDHVYLLNENGTVAYHKSLASGSPRPEAKSGQLISETTLENGMTLVVNVDKAEIYHDRNMMATVIIMLCIVIVMIFI